MSLLLHCWHYH